MTEEEFYSALHWAKKAEKEKLEAEAAAQEAKKYADSAKGIDITYWKEDNNG